MFKFDYHSSWSWIIKLDDSVNWYYFETPLIWWFNSMLHCNETFQVLPTSQPTLNFVAINWFGQMSKFRNQVKCVKLKQESFSHQVKRDNALKVYVRFKLVWTSWCQGVSDNYISIKLRVNLLFIMDKYHNYIS